MSLGPLAITTELQVNGSWVDVSADVYDRDSVQITRGRADEGAQVDPGKCTFTLNNRDGKYSPRNPLSPYYGLIGRNTPVRVSVNAGTPHLDLDGSPTGNATTPDTAALDITGDIDLRCEAAIDWNKPGANQALLSKWDATGNQRSYMLRAYNGALYISWSADGIAPLAASYDLPYLPRRAAVRATLAVNAGGNVVATFYWATSISGPWTQFGQFTSAGTTSIFSGTAPLTLGGYDPGTSPQRLPAVGTIYRAEVRSGIDGTVVSSVDTTTSPAITDTTGKVWTVNGSARYGNRLTRFVGEISSWPSRWDVSGSDVYVPVEAAGILRRLGQGATPLHSPMRREFSNPARTSIVAYWPLEDGSGATSFASAESDAAPMVVKTGKPDASAYSDFAASEPLPFLNDALLTGAVPSYSAASGQTSLRVYVVFPANPSAEQPLLTLNTTGLASRWVISRTTAGGLVLRAYDADGNTLLDDTMVVNLASQSVSLGLDLVQNGTGVDWKLYYIDAAFAVWQISSTLNTTNVGRVTSMSLGGGDNSNVAVGHLALATDTNAWASTAGALKAYVGESVCDRVWRLATEEKLPAYVVDPEHSSILAGAQTADTVLNILQDAADADSGVLYEQREATGLQFRAHTTFYNQPASLTLDYAAGQVAPPLEPIDDDQATRNDVTVERPGGTSARAVLESGPMSVLDPPNGIGRYADSETANVASDDLLPDVAGWRLHVGTFDGYRYPVITVNLFASPELVDQAAATDIGDRIVITNVPAWLPPDPVDQLAQGYEETLGLYEWSIAYNASPAGPWNVANADDTARVDTDGSALAADFSAALNANPYFTGGDISGWVAFQGTVAASQAVSGGPSAWSCLFTSNGTNGGAIEGKGNTFAVTAGSVYETSAWVYLPAGGNVQIGVDWQNSAHGYMSTSTKAVAVPAGVWTPIGSGALVAPTGAVFAYSRVGLQTATAGQLLYAQNIVSWNGAVQVTTTAGPLWTTSAADFPFDVVAAGERMTVTGVADTVTDTFTRTTSGGWGTTDSGQPWTTAGGTTADFATNGSAGTIASPTVNSSRVGKLATVAFADQDVRCDMSVSALATGAAISTGLILRYKSGANYYYAELLWNTDGTLSLQLVYRDSSVVVIAGPVVVGSYAAGDKWTVRAQVIGSTVRAKAWIAGSPEPDNWDLTVIDSTLGGAWPVGLRSFTYPGSTNTAPVASFDNYRVVSPQAFSVARGMYGVTKAHAAGEDIRLADPSIIAL